MEDRTRVEMRVGPARLADDAEAAPRLGNSGEQIVQELNGRYYEQVVRGNVFIYSTVAAGINPVIPITTGGNPTIWNPAGSGYNLIPMRLLMGYVSGNNVPGFFHFNITANTGANIGAGLPIVTFTDVAPVSALLGSGKTSRMRWAPAVSTFVANPVFLMTLGLSQFTGIATTAVAPWQYILDFDGTLILGPGNALTLGCNAANTSVYSIALIGMELPIPLFA